MDYSAWLLFLTFAFVTALTPGPGVMLVVSNAVGFGVRAAALCSLGNAMGLFFVSGATMIGLGAVLKSSAVFFGLLKILGAGYLIYLGIRQWRSGTNVFAQPNIKHKEKGGAARFMLQGLLLAPTNPKSILFFAALLPQFIKPEEPILMQFFILTATFAASTVVSHISYAFLARQTRGWFSSNHRVRIFNRVSGGALMLLGANMLRLKNNPG